MPSHFCPHNISDIGGVTITKIKLAFFRIKFVIFSSTQVYVTYEEEKNKFKNFSLQKRNFYLSVGASQVGVYQGLDYYTGLSCY